MHYSIGIRLKALDTDKIIFFTGKKLHAVFLSLIQEEQKDVSKELHDKQQPKEFTVSPLLGGDSGEIIEGKNYFFRVTFLTEDLFDIFSKKIASKMLGKIPVKLEKCRFTIEEIIYKDSALAGKYSELKNLKKRLTLEFMSPTMFKDGDYYIRYPEKKYLFKSLLMRYNMYSDKKISETILDELHKVQYERMDIKLKRVQMKNYFMEGFVGSCSIRIDSKDNNFIVDINNLLNFLFFSGVGQKTSMGFGQGRAKY
jgi:CRISPR-associated endoribonuclease Cas6